MIKETGLEKLKYPIGRFDLKIIPTTEQTREAIKSIAFIPEKLSRVFEQLKTNNLDKTYREGGWTATQLINHFADVYTNAYMRTKWLLTENNAVLKPYNEEEWINANGSYPHLEKTILLITCLIDRWVYLLNSLSDEAFEKTIFHPEYQIVLSLHKLVAMYNWHGLHHLAHLQIITSLS